MSHTVGRLLAVAALAVLVATFRAGEPPLAGTEGHRVLTATQMAGSSDPARWLAPRLFEKPYLTKPPLHYWTLAAVEIATGIGSPRVWRLTGAGGFVGITLFVAWMCGRWFGSAGGWAGGMAAVSLVALWSQSRSAEIDPSNTFAAAVACGCMIERLVRRGGSVWAAGLIAAMTAGAMLKGPAMLPAVLGTWLGVAYGLRSWRVLASPAVWTALAIAVGALAMWYLAAGSVLAQEGLAMDATGAREAATNLTRFEFRRLVGIAGLVPQLLLFSLPASAALLLVRPAVRIADPPTATLLRSLVAGIAASWAVCIISGMVNPRYAYVTLPLLAMLAGGVAGVLWGNSATHAALHRLAAGAVTLLALAGAGFTAAAGRWDDADAKPAIAAALLATVAAGMAWRQRVLPGDACGLLAVAVVLLIVPAARFQRYDRAERSGFAAAATLRQLVPAGEELLVGRLVSYQPELLHYAGIQARWLGPDESVSPPRIPGDAWLLLNPRELIRWRREAPARIASVDTFTSNAAPCHVVRVVPQASAGGVFGALPPDMPSGVGE